MTGWLPLAEKEPAGTVRTWVRKRADSEGNGKFDGRLTRTKLSNLGRLVTRVEVFSVDIVSICADSQGSSDILNLGAGSSDIKSDGALCTIVFDLKVCDRDGRVVEAASETGRLQDICTKDSDRQSA